MAQRLIILGEYSSDSETHRATDAAIGHSLAQLETELTISWISTATIKATDILQANGLWVAPGSPYKDFLRALEAIRLARENLVPCLGTCGGFQHMILEFARNVLGIANAKHAEYDPEASQLFISALNCSITGMELPIKIQPNTKARFFYAKDVVVEFYYCNFGVNPQYSNTLAGRRDLVISGRGPNGEIRIIEILNHPFFIGTLFVPQKQSKALMPHPLVSGFLQAVLRHRTKDV